MSYTWKSGSHSVSPLNEASGTHIRLKFQDGGVAEHGINGTTNEEVIELLMERIDSLNQPPFNCRENSLAITHLEEALNWLHRRTHKRQARGVEGTSTP